MNSILLTIKKTLGVAAEDDIFNDEIILAINTAFMSLMQLGVGVSTGFSVVDVHEEWADFLGTSTDLEGVKSYMALKCRLLFDPPSSSFVIDAIQRQIEELEFRLLVQVDPPVIPTP